MKGLCERCLEEHNIRKEATQHENNELVCDECHEELKKILRGELR